MDGGDGSVCYHQHFQILTSMQSNSINVGGLGDEQVWWIMDKMMVVRRRRRRRAHSHQEEYVSQNRYKLSVLVLDRKQCALTPGETLVCVCACVGNITQNIYINKTTMKPYTDTLSCRTRTPLVYGFRHHHQVIRFLANTVPLLLIWVGGVGGGRCQERTPPNGRRAPTVDH